MSNSHFARGSGSYPCSVCGKQTRETGQGESSVKMCAACNEITQQENFHFDHDHAGEIWDCPICTPGLSPQAVANLKYYRSAG